MDCKIIAFLLLSGVLTTLCVGGNSDETESSTSTSVSVSTVTRKVTSRSFSRPPPPLPPPNETQTVTEDSLGLQEIGKPVNASAKPQKIKKKILASNLKNLNEKIVFPGEKHEKIISKPVGNVTETADVGKPNSSDSAEDEIAEDGKGENVTGIAKAGGRKSGGPSIEGRSLEDRSSEENANVNANAKAKAPTSTTVRTTSYETFAGFQKVLNSNYLNNNDAGAGNGRPTAKKPAPIARENSLKNAIRFESEYYGPTGQTDWIPIIPDKVPVRSPPGGAFGTKLKPPAPVEKSNKTDEKNAIVFPSDGVRPFVDAEVGKTTTPRVRSSVRTSATTTEREKGNGNGTKFRGIVRFKPARLNSTTAKGNDSREVLGSSWTLATLGSSAKPVREETTEISVVSSTNHTTKSQNAVDGGLAVPPENVKVENVTKEPQMKVGVPGATDDAKHNRTEITNPMMIDGGQGWIPIKMEKDGEGKNDTEVVVPGTVLPEMRNESTTEAPRSSTGETTTEETATPTEITPEVTIFPKLLSTSTETSVASSQSEMEEVTSVATEDTTVVPTIVAVQTDSVETETPTEVQPTTFPNFVETYSTRRGEEEEETETSEATPTARPTTEKKQTTGETTSSTTTAAPPTSSTAETKIETSEEGIYYKNYVPTTASPHEITEENVPAYLRLTVQARDWEELCRLKEDLRDAIIKMLGGKNVSAESVHFLNLSGRSCQEKIVEESRGEARNGTVFLPVNMFLMDRNGDFDKNLSEAFLTLWGRRGLDFELPIRKVDFVTPIVNLTELADPALGGSVVAAIVISCVAGICVILLGVLFVIMKRRQKRFNYGQRCTPVSLDAYSLDSVSIYNSVRRKDVRASKRSYGNAAFDYPEVPTHPVNFAGLANFSSDKEQLYEEFNIIPQVYPKVEELPPGAETKNRYANIIPLPETRVNLTVRDGDPLSYYINANYVRGLKGVEKLYIACQAPMESTVEDFWRMIWEQQSKVILMLTDLQENGIEKCADYLPPNEITDNLRLFGDFQVTLKKRDVKEKYIISNLKLKNMEANLWREVTHLWYLGWPDQGVPSEANSLIAFLIEARSQMKIQNGATAPSPIVVHCSPGTGRTGTVIACDLCIREYEQSRMVDIPRCVFNLRRDRAGAVQTKDQYAFIYHVLNVYATKLSGGGIESI